MQLQTESFTALYLKYRPQNLDQLIGQDNVKKTLLSSFNNSKLSHAYLFVGPRGTGKTSTARILAKMVNCEKKDKAPCNQCATCLSITDGSNLDLIEIDAASNRGIDDIRSLRENIKLSPSSLNKKVYIIDEVHMLTTEAFNALLKTLEEPPTHAIFILATTEGQKIPQTILSRVQRLDFKLASTLDIETALKNVINGEKIDIDDEAIKLIARAAEGGFRDAIKILDQLKDFDGKITVEQVNQSLRSSDFDTRISLLKTLSEKKAGPALASLTQQVDLGVDIKGLTLSLMETLRSLLYIKNDLGETLIKPQYGDDKYKQLDELAGNYSMDDLIRALSNFQEGLENIKNSSLPVAALELAMVKICRSEKVIETVRNEFVVQEKVPEKITGGRDDSIPASTIVETVVETGKDLNSPEAAILKEKWTFVLETVRSYNYSLEALLRSVKVAECHGNQVVFEVPYSFHQRILETPKSRDLLESVLSDVLGKPVKISSILGTKPMQMEDIANVEVAADDEVLRAASEIFEGKMID